MHLPRLRALEPCEPQPTGTGVDGRGRDSPRQHRLVSPLLAPGYLSKISNGIAGRGLAVSRVRRRALIHTVITPGPYLGKRLYYPFIPPYNISLLPKLRSTASCASSTSHLLRTEAPPPEAVLPPGNNAGQQRDTCTTLGGVCFFSALRSCNGARQVYAIRPPWRVGGCKILIAPDDYMNGIDVDSTLVTLVTVRARRAVPTRAFGLTQAMGMIA